MKQVSVLILEDSFFFRELLKRELEQDSNIKVVAMAADAYSARDKIIEHRPDVLIADIIIEKMNGIEFVKKLLPQYFIPIIMISSDHSYKDEVKKLNVYSFVGKPKGNDAFLMEMFVNTLIMQIKNITNNDSPIFNLVDINPKVIAIGASTGGAEAIEVILKDLPSVMPPIVVAQHMPPKFTKTFSQRLNAGCKLSVKEAADGDHLIPGQAYIAPGGYHTSVVKRDKKYFIKVEENIQGVNVCPSVDILFDSIAANISENAIGVILTGMGKDGAAGLLKIKDKKGKTIGQDEESSVIYGMPKVAFDMGAVGIQLPLNQIAKKIIELAAK